MKNSKNTKSNKSADKKEKQVPQIICERFKVDTSVGLSEAQVLQREKEKLTNKSKTKSTKSYLQIFAGNIFTFFNMLCFGVFLALIVVGKPINTMFMVVIVANLLIGLILEIKAKRTVEKISLVTAPTALVVRDGKQVRIPATKVVLDDIIIYELGNQICTDAVVLEGSMRVNESLLTGESSPITKSVGDKLLAGSFVVSGTCIVKADGVGEQNYSTTLVAKAKKRKAPESDILRAVRTVIKSIGIIILPLAVGTFLKKFYSGPGDYVEAIGSTSTSMIGMIPAGMFLLVSTALAVGIIKLARKRTLVQDLYSIEMLARATVLCLDKTGTITDGTMKVNTIIPLAKHKLDEIMKTIAIMNYNLKTQNQTSKALSDFCGKREEIASASMEFSSDKKLAAISIDGKTYVLGAPEFVLKTIPARLKKKMEGYLNEGARVLMLCEMGGEIGGEDLPEAERTPLGIVVIEDNIKADAIETIKWFNDNDVEIKIISGDNAVAVSAISKRVGIYNANKFISLEGKTDKQVYKAALKYSVFGRVSPEQKAIIIKALKDNKHKVAMTGDGVNDILALKEADCSIAMANGSEAARNVSSIVMRDSNFASMPSIVAEGRRVVNNIAKSSSLFLMKTFFTIFLTIFCFFTTTGFPFQNPNQLLLLELFVIGIPSFMLALQENKQRIKGDFMTNLTVKAFPAALTLTLNGILCYVFVRFLPMTANEFATLCSLMLLIGGIVILFRLCRPFDKFRLIMFFSCLLAVSGVLAITYLFLPVAVFGYVSLGWAHVGFLAGMAALTYFVHMGMTALVSKLATIKFRKNETDKVASKTKVDV
ncbi:MAG: HAD-IC family P-type ATPase [Christensenellaceae bacterium]|jgi:cation-transporting ATPase E|nr:HAD-IC family P-type ATPase [Christensenellaceae bacterium]